MNKSDFPMLINNNDIIYFDNAATTFKPKSVVESTINYYTKYTTNANRGDYDIAYKVDTLIENARKKVAEFINTNRNNIVFTSGTTDSINMVANCFFKNILKPGDEILITSSEHASNVLPWFNLAKTNGVVVKFIELDDNYNVTLDKVKEAITDKTKLISLAHVTNVVGDVRPIKEITKLAHENNIYVLVDGAQSVPHIKTDVVDLDIDFLAFSLHKMMGPTGVGILYGKQDLLNKFSPINLGGGMNESFDDVDHVILKDVPTRLEAGTLNIAGIVAINEVIDYINNIGIDNISKYESSLKEYLVNNLKTIDHIHIINESSKSGIISFYVDDVFAQDVAYYLNKYKICVRAGNHCAKILKNVTGVKNTVRISLYLYNTKDECDILYELLKDKNRIIREMI